MTFLPRVHICWAISVAFLAAFLVFPSIATADLDATIEITANGNPLAFSNPIPARGDQIPIEGFAGGVTVPFDATSGASAGIRQHQPVIIVKRIDETTPLIYKALLDNDPITATIRFYPQADPSTPYYEIEITSGHVVSVQDAGGDADEVPTESVAIVFGSITWTHNNGGTTHNDNWNSGGGT